MQFPIFQINVNAGRREADQDAVQKLADSISKVGLLNPITFILVSLHVDPGHQLQFFIMAR